ncbi:PepSY-associated TM helix domain-containing protein [Sphingobacterium sp. SG20118]|uniref:PepSY-associated TM helix domain-containing protein n=1 Tax=Sphingobacterium sp. SG20118 TaxID=3367156 RepID=UPI0037DFC9EE
MIKKSILWLHKWLGLFTGIVVFIVSLSGCLYVFHDELKLMIYPQKYYLQDGLLNHNEPLPLTQLIEYAQKALPKQEHISRADLYLSPNRTWVFRAVKTNEHAFGHNQYFIYHKRIFINPYSGKVQYVENSKTEFFQLILQLHMNLLLGKQIGHWVVGISIVLFIIILLSGIVLWWPKKWKLKKVKRQVWFNFNVKWKRLNYDLHQILGFYSFSFALLLACTGIAFTFPSFKDFYIKTFNTISFSQKINLDKKFDKVPQTQSKTLDNALIYTLDKHPNAEMMSIRLRKNIANPQDIQVRFVEDRTGQFIWYYFNQSTGQIQKINQSKNAPLGDKIGAMNYDLHVGSYGGLTTKILTFLMGLICASLPVTGMIIWINKMKKKKRK